MFIQAKDNACTVFNSDDLIALTKRDLNIDCTDGTPIIPIIWMELRGLGGSAVQYTSQESRDEAMADIIRALGNCT